MSEKKTELDIYLSRVSVLLDDRHHKKNVNLEQIRQSIMEIPGWEFMDQIQLSKAYGSPDELVEEYLTTLEPLNFIHTVKSKKKAVRIFGTLVIITLLVLTICAITYAIDVFKFNNGYYIERVYEHESISEPSQESEITPRTY